MPEPFRSSDPDFVRHHYIFHCCFRLYNGGCLYNLERTLSCSNSWNFRSRRKFFSFFRRSCIHGHSREYSWRIRAHTWRRIPYWSVHHGFGIFDRKFSPSIYLLAVFKGNFSKASHIPAPYIKSPEILFKRETFPFFPRNRLSVLPPPEYRIKHVNSVVKIIPAKEVSCGIKYLLEFIKGGKRDIINAQPFGFAIAVIKPWATRDFLLIFNSL